VLAGSSLGSHVNRRADDANVRHGFALLTAFLAFQMAWRAWRG